MCTEGHLSTATKKRTPSEFKVTIMEQNHTEATIRPPIAPLASQQSLAVFQGSWRVRRAHFKGPKRPKNNQKSSPDGGRLKVVSMALLGGKVACTVGHKHHTPLEVGKSPRGALETTL